MHPETIFAVARIAEVNRELSAPMLLRRHEAIVRRAEERRSRRRQFVARARRVVWNPAIGRRGRIAPIGEE
jgi:hypothetical protein